MSAFTMDADWLHWHQNLQSQNFWPPAGAVDAHCHVFGPGDQFPFAPEPSIPPVMPPRDQLWDLRIFGIYTKRDCSRRPVMEQTTVRLDGRPTAFGRHGPRSSDGQASRSQTVNCEICIPRSAWSSLQLCQNDWWMPLPFDALGEIASKIQPLGWHIVIYFEATELPELFASSTTATTGD